MVIMVRALTVIQCLANLIFVNRLTLAWQWENFHANNFQMAKTSSEWFLL